MPSKSAGRLDAPQYSIGWMRMRCIFVERQAASPGHSIYLFRVSPAALEFQVHVVALVAIMKLRLG